MGNLRSNSFVLSLGILFCLSGCGEGFQMMRVQSLKQLTNTPQIEQAKNIKLLATASIIKDLEGIHYPSILTGNSYVENRMGASYWLQFNQAVDLSWVRSMIEVHQSWDSDFTIKAGANPTQVVLSFTKLPETFGKACFNVMGAQPVHLDIAPGDFNQDGVVDDQDANHFITAYNEVMVSGAESALFDYNHDGIVDDQDFSIFQKLYNEMSYSGAEFTCPI